MLRWLSFLKKAKKLFVDVLVCLVFKEQILHSLVSDFHNITQFFKQCQYYFLKKENRHSRITLHLSFAATVINITSISKKVNRFYCFFTIIFYSPGNIDEISHVPLYQD